MENEEESEGLKVGLFWCKEEEDKNGNEEEEKEIDFYKGLRQNDSFALLSSFYSHFHVKSLL